MKNVFYLGLVLLVLTSSCKKDLLTEEAPSPITPTVRVQKFNQIKTQDAFSWESNKLMSLSITGMSDMDAVRNTLTVTDESGEVSYLKVSLKMSENYSTTFTIPTVVEKVVVSYGSIKKIYNTQGASVQFNYIPDVAE